MGQYCSTDQVLEGGLCYTKCREGYYGDSIYCWSTCPTNFPDSGATFCEKPSSYGRGAGHLTKSYCESTSDHGAKENGCEYYYGLWYPKCDKGFHNYDCCVCTPTCPDGMYDTGATCEKHRYYRGSGGVPPIGMSWTTILIIILALLIILMISIKI